MKNILEEEDFCKIFAFAEENKLPFLQGWEFLQREELEQDNGPGQKVSQEKEPIVNLWYTCSHNAV